MDISVELSVFNNIKYFDEPHTYFIDVREMTSATRLIGKFKQSFDSEYWSTKKAKERGISQEEILAEWKYKADYSCEKGTLLHEYAENYLNNKIFPYNDERGKKLLKEGPNDLKKDFEKLKTLFHQFYEDSYGKLIPIKDQLFWNNKANELQIWDWKTNKEIKRNNKWQQFKDPIAHLDVCEFNTYSLQLSLYRFIIEKNTNLKLGDSYIVWFNEKNTHYEPIKCRDYRPEIVSLIEEFNKDI